MTETLPPAPDPSPAWRSGFADAADIAFRELLELLPAAAYTTDADGLITYFNRHALALWGRAPKLHDPVDRYCGSFRLFDLEGASIPHDRCWMALALNEDRSYNGKEIVIERADGSRRTVLAHANPIHGERGAVRGAVNVLVDITDRRLAELRLRESDEAKTEFLAMLAHELRNPLAALKSAAELSVRATDDAMRARAAATLDRQLQHLGRIVGDLVDIARITRRTLELRTERIDLRPILDEVADAARPSIDGAGQRLEVGIARDPIPLDGDAVRLTQLFGNLIANASKYSPAGSAIHLTAARQGSEVVVSVRDEGMGIAPESQAVIFDMFARGPSNGQDGLGVGLTLAQHLARLHGGMIEVFSAGPGMGADFRVHLPIALDVASVSAGTETGRAGGGHRILIVDDNRDAADTLAALLELEGNETHVAHDGDGALRIAEGRRPDVVLLDIGLPRLNGYEVAQRMRAADWGRDLTLIALTGWGHPNDRERSHEAGFDHHLVKPVEVDELIRLLDEPEGGPAA